MVVNKVDRAKNDVVMDALISLYEEKAILPNLYKRKTL